MPKTRSSYNDAREVTTWEKLPELLITPHVHVLSQDWSVDRKRTPEQLWWSDVTFVPMAIEFRAHCERPTSQWMELLNVSVLARLVITVEQRNPRLEWPDIHPLFVGAESCKWARQRFSERLRMPARIPWRVELIFTPAFVSRWNQTREAEKSFMVLVHGKTMRDVA